MQGILWLASYPRAGNTWLRIFFANLLRDSKEPADINSLVEVGHASSRSWFDAAAGIESSDLLPAEIDELRAPLFQALADEAPGTLFIKTHDAFRYAPSGEPIVPPQATRGVIYIARNPLDVAVSYSHHLDRPYDQIIRIMSDENHSVDVQTQRMLPPLGQRIGSWSGHVLSWINSGLPLKLIRYEDMLNSPLEIFASIATFAGITYTPEQLRRAIKFSEFGELQKQEARQPFRDRSRRSLRFFRRGIAGGWRNELTTEQAQRIVASHGEVMRLLGYETAETELSC